MYKSLNKASKLLIFSVTAATVYIILQESSANRYNRRIFSGNRIHGQNPLQSSGDGGAMGTYTHAEKEMNKRLERVRTLCAKNAKNVEFSKQPGGLLWSIKNYDINYCITPKIGSTHWKRILRFIAGDYSNKLNVTKPGDLSRYDVHYTSLEKIERVGFRNVMDGSVPLRGQSFMFTREPFSRLWSAYIDKFLLPDYWRVVAPSVARKVRPEPVGQDITCVKDVTFPEFLQFIVQSNSNELDPHWRPIYKLCHPCQVHYDVIGKHETFANDSNLILLKFGLKTVVPDEKSTSFLRAIEEMTTLVKFYFDVENIRKLPEGCFEKEDGARRLWKAFQYNGYIHRDLHIPMEKMRADKFSENASEVFLKYAIETLQFQIANNYDLGNQKRDFMLAAYERIPRTIVNSIKQIYKYDFELFGYDKDLL